MRGGGRGRRWMGEIKISLGRRRLEEQHGSGVLFEVFDAHERSQPYMCVLYTCRSLHSCLCGWWALEVFGPRISPTAAQPEVCGWAVNMSLLGNNSWFRA